MSFIVHPTKWEVEHARAIFTGQSYQSEHDGQLPDTAMWRMLKFRHSLNPSRFDHWHPNIGLMLDQTEPGDLGSLLSQPQEWIGRTQGTEWPDEAVAQAQLERATIPPSISGLKTSAIEQPPSFSTHSVPEPSGVVQGLAALMLAAAYLSRRRRLRRNA